MGSGLGSVALYEGKAEGITDGFYGEVVDDDGRIHVFSQWADLKSFLSVGEAPKGETIVYVLNKKNKKKRPDVLMAEFNKKHSK